MPVSSDAKHYIKSVVVALLGAVAAALGIVAVGFFGDYFKANPFYAPIMITGSLGIDVFGAIVPVIVGLICAVLLFGLRFPPKKFGVALAASIVLAFLLSRLTDEGLVGYPLLFAIATAIVMVALNYYSNPFATPQKKFLPSLLLALICVPLSLIVVDLAYSTVFPNSVLGGNGLTDGILISTLYAPFVLTAALSVVSYVSETVLLIRKQQVASKKQLGT
ncbi:MAG: hypothetical protein M1540_04775 [Candidatus Bathyarchaeota archaeon]|nr:hypothetical protein [Chloroflexota bacterium]MCL5877107.1 hypothetical protein [Candidatus Bathyarchaeota archaeon]